VEELTSGGYKLKKTLRKKKQKRQVVCFGNKAICRGKKTGRRKISLYVDKGGCVRGGKNRKTGGQGGGRGDRVKGGRDVSGRKNRKGVPVAGEKKKKPFCISQRPVWRSFFGLSGGCGLVLHLVELGQGAGSEVLEVKW